MPYSEHRDLQKLHHKIDQYTCHIAGLKFTGSGLNDITVSGTITAKQPISFKLEITDNGTDFDYFKWSKTAGRSWHATDVPIAADDVYIDLDEGVQVKFKYAGGHNIRSHTVGDCWEWVAYPVHSSEERKMAYDWLNDQLEAYMTTPVSSPSESVILAEATYACYLILRANGDPDADKFRIDTQDLIRSYIETRQKVNQQNSPTSDSENVRPVFTRGKRDFDGNIVGETMGRSSGWSGNLDRW